MKKFYKLVACVVLCICCSHTTKSGFLAPWPKFYQCLSYSHCLSVHALIGAHWFFYRLFTINKRQCRGVLLIQSFILIGLYYFSLKQINNGKYIRSRKYHTLQTGTYSVDPDETPQNAVSNQGILLQLEVVWGIYIYTCIRVIVKIRQNSCPFHILWKPLMWSWIFFSSHNTTDHT